MENEILKIVYDCSKKRKLIGEKEIRTIVALVLEEKEISDYVQKIKMSKKSPKNGDKILGGSWVNSKKRLKIYIKNLYYYTKYEKRFKLLRNPLEQLIAKNLFIVQIIFHELEHAHQQKQYDEGINSIEEKLIEANILLTQFPARFEKVWNGLISSELFELYEANDKILYYHYYNSNPVERLADTNSFSTIVSIVEQEKEKMPYLFEYYNYLLNIRQIKNYKESWQMRHSCPTENYLHGIMRPELWDEIEKSYKENEYDLTRRLKLGLNINKDEYFLIESLTEHSKFNI